MKRSYEKIFAQHFKQNRQMLFVMGPRQTGKTTISQDLLKGARRGKYLSWDIEEDRELILMGARHVARTVGLGSQEKQVPLLVFDELHKYSKWKTFLKGLYDGYPFMAQTLVTGSARLDVYRRGEDSLMGRYFRFRMHPLSVRELAEPGVLPGSPRPTPCAISDDQFDALRRFGGFPDPLLRADETYHERWSSLRLEQLFYEDLRDLSRVKEIGQLEKLAEFLRRSAGKQISYRSLSNKVRVAATTISSWLDLLASVYYSFAVRPWSRNLSRSLLKEPKYYMIDWSMVEDPGARAENMIACHLLKAVHMWTDLGLGKYELYYLRDKEKREVDFVITLDDRPWLLAEVKLSNSHAVSPSLHYFQSQLRANYALQVVFEMPPSQKTCFLDAEPRVVSARSFLSQLV